MTPSRRIAATFLTLVLAMVAALAGLAGLTPSYAGTASTAATSAHLAPASQSASLAASDGYTYWAYFTWDASASNWQLAPVGANDKKIDPEDGDVYGFRWALNVGTTSAREPRAGGDFAAICGSEPTTGSGVRIAYVIDYGTSTDAPSGQQPPEPRGICLNAKGSATVQQALQAATPVRTSGGGFLCAIDNYPSSGCGDTFKNAKNPPPDQPVELVLPTQATGSASDTSTNPSDATSSQSDSESDSGSGAAWPIILTIAIVAILTVGALVVRRRRS